MNTQISFHNIERASQPGLEGTILELAMRHVERYLSRFPPDAADLQVHVEKSRHRNYYQASMELHVPGGTLRSWQEGYDVLAVVRQAFDELERELLRHVARLRQEETWKRKERREQLRRLKQAIDAHPATAADAFGQLVRVLLPQLQRFVQREIAALRARGDLDPDYPTPLDIVDAVLARAYERLANRPKDLEPLQWLYQLTHEVLTEEVRKSPREKSGVVPAESKPPRHRDYTLAEQDEGVNAIWQPDEMLRLDAVEPVTGATPEDAVEEGELRRYFHDALARMPNNWRRAIWLVQAEGIPVAQAARTMGASEEEVKRWIQQGDEYVRALLREVGYRPADEGKQPAYFVPNPAPETQALLEALDDVMDEAK